MNSLVLFRNIGALEIVARLLAGCAAHFTPTQNTEVEQIDGGAMQFGQWVAGCSNLGTCTALAILDNKPDEDEPTIVRVTFAKQFKCSVIITIQLDASSITRLSDNAACDLKRNLLAESETGTAALTENSINYEVPREGFSKLNAAIEHWQGIQPQGVSNVFVVTPFAAQPINEFTPPRWISEAAENCPNGKLSGALRAWRGVNGSLLWQARCDGEGLNTLSDWYYSSNSSAVATRVIFPSSKGSATPHNSELDSENGLLTMTHYFGGQYSYSYEDCGIYRTYGWSTDGLKLINERFMPKCGTGIDRDDWIVTFQAVVLN
jgi:hypothetical protein